MKQSAGLSLCSRDDIRTHQKCVKVRTSIKEAIKERETKRINATEREPRTHVERGGMFP